MNIIDRNFADLAKEIRSMNQQEIFLKILSSYEKVPEETRESCIAFFRAYDFWGALDPAAGIYDQIEGKAQALAEHIGDFEWLYERLGDYRSKKTLYAILSNWYRYDFAATTETKEYLFDSYFDLDVVRCGKDEVIVNLGAYTGDTILSYIKNYGEDCYQKIYCYEITPQTFGYLKENLRSFRGIDLRLKGIGDRPESMFIRENSTSSSANTLGGDSGEEIGVTTLDDDIKEPVSLIIADIEGFEQKAILGARKHILQDHPKLLISVYHNNEDLWKIPRMIHDISPDYQFYLRYKSSPIYPTEITLLAV